MFHSVADIIGCGDLYQSRCQPLERLQNRLIRIIGLTHSDIECPLTIKQTFVGNAIMQHYEILKTEVVNNRNYTRHVSTELTANSLTVMSKIIRVLYKKVLQKSIK